MLTLLNCLSKYFVVILGFLAITFSYAQEFRADDTSILDIDGSGEVDALTDGLLLLRSMFELTDDALVTGVVDSVNCKECDAEGIDSYITSIKGATYGGLTPEPGPPGPQGEKGDKGDTGPQGEKGDKGDTGPQGEKGDKGDTGSQGIAGADGAKGDTGATGAKGDTGSQGIQGIKGDTGSQGIAGADGAKGDTGATGASGVAGSVTELTDALVEDNSLYIANDPSATTSDAQHNVAIGPNALIAITTGDANIAVGFSLTSNTEGSVNTSVGYGALKENLTGNYNSGYGRGALIENTTGSGNTAYGWDALSENKTGSYNTAVGAKADLGADNLTNATAIGNGAIVTASNTMQLGNTSVTNVKTSGSVTAGAITIPNTDGVSGQVLKTNGSGTLSWAGSSQGFAPVSLALINGTYSLGNNSTTVVWYQIFAEQTMAVSKISVWGTATNTLDTVRIGLYRGVLGGSSGSTDATLIGQGSANNTNGTMARSEILLSAESGQNLNITEMESLIIGISVNKNVGNWDPWVNCSGMNYFGNDLNLTRSTTLDYSTMPASPVPYLGSWKSNCKPIVYIH
jgi:hypothetical protein